jgi:hypothetical protein
VVPSDEDMQEDNSIEIGDSFLAPDEEDDNFNMLLMMKVKRTLVLAQLCPMQRF